MKITRLLFLIGLATIFHFGNSETYAGCFFQDESKSIRATEFIKKRPPAPKPADNKLYTPTSGKNPVNTTKERYYRYVKAKRVKKTAVKPPVKTMENAVLGFTLFRLTDVEPENKDAKGFELSRKGKTEKTERIEAETALAVGDKARIAIESPTHTGYLYIINREKFADGTYGVAKLIFPTSNTRNNIVGPGILTFIPSLSSPPFEIESRTDRKQTDEELTVIVSPKPLIDSALLQEDAISISTDRLMEWVSKWEVDEVQRELDGGVGQIMSAAEQNVGRDESKGFEIKKPALTQADEPPQTVFDMKIKRGNPLLTRILLQIKPD